MQHLAWCKCVRNLHNDLHLRRFGSQVCKVSCIQILKENPPPHLCYNHPLITSPSKNKYLLMKYNFMKTKTIKKKLQVLSFQTLDMGEGTLKTNSREEQNQTPIFSASSCNDSLSKRIHTLQLNFLFSDWLFTKYAQCIENVHWTPRTAPRLRTDCARCFWCVIACANVTSTDPFFSLGKVVNILYV